MRTVFTFQLTGKKAATQGLAFQTRLGLLGFRRVGSVSPTWVHPGNSEPLEAVKAAILDAAGEAGVKLEWMALMRGGDVLQARAPHRGASLQNCLDAAYAGISGYFERQKLRASV